MDEMDIFSKFYILRKEKQTKESWMSEPNVLNLNCTCVGNLLFGGVRQLVYLFRFNLCHLFTNQVWD